VKFKPLSRIDNPSAEAMLPDIDACRRGRVWVWSSDAFKMALIIFENLAWNSVNLSIYTIFTETVTFDCQYLSTGGISSGSINRIDSGYSLNLVAGGILIVASHHGIFHVLCVSHAEPDINIHWGVGSDCSHATANITSRIDWQDGVCFDEALEVHSVPVEADLDPRELRQGLALSTLGISRINPERDFWVWVDNRWLDEIKEWSESAIVCHRAVWWRELWAYSALDILNLLSHTVIINQANLIGDRIEWVEGFLRLFVNFHQRRRCVLELASTSMWIKGDIHYLIKNKYIGSFFNKFKNVVRSELIASYL